MSDRFTFAHAPDFCGEKQLNRECGEKLSEKFRKRDSTKFMDVSCVLQQNIREYLHRQNFHIA